MPAKTTSWQRSEWRLVHMLIGKQSVIGKNPTDSEISHTDKSVL
jgi:hypothetical protein